MVSKWYKLLVLALAIVLPVRSAWTATPGWQGIAFRCIADPPFADEATWIPGDWLEAVAPHGLKNGNIATVTAYPAFGTGTDFDIAYPWICKVGGQWTASNAPKNWIGIYWNDKYPVKDYQFEGGLVIPYDEPGGAPVATTGGSSVMEPCQVSGWNPAQQQEIFSHPCQSEAFYRDECFWSNATHNAYLYFYSLPDAATCEARNNGAGDVTVRPDGSLCDGFCPVPGVGA